MTQEIQMTLITELQKLGVQQNQIDLTQLADDWQWWEDVELTCLFYKDRVQPKKVKKRNKKVS